MIHRRHWAAGFGLLGSLCLAAPALAQMRITEVMYSGTNGEIIEFTNIGSTPVDMTGWSFDDDTRTPGSTPLSAYGVVAPGESVILTEIAAEIFRSGWNLCSGVKIIGNNANNLGRNDELNLYDASGALVDRLSYGDETYPGSVRTQNVSARPLQAAIGTNSIAQWVASTVGDADGGYASVGNSIGSPARSAAASVAFNPCPLLQGVMRISEFQYDGRSGEFIEFTNVGNAPLDMTGWSFDDDSRLPGNTPLSAFGIVKPGESVVLTDAVDSAFRTAWGLCPAAKVIGGSTTGLGRADEINLFDATGTLVDRLTYGDQTIPGSIRTQYVSGWVAAAGLGANAIAQWQLSVLDDAQASHASLQGDLGSPNRNAQSATPFDPCPPVPPPVRITEYMYSGADGEFIEFTNVGDVAVDMSGWSFDDDSRVAGTQALGAFGSVQPGESVILTESVADTFRAAWGLCSGVKVIGGSTTGLGNGDEINLFDGSGVLVDRLTYPNGGPPLANGGSAWVPAGAVGNNTIASWTLSTLGDAEASITSTGGAIGRPGRSERRAFNFDPCLGQPGAPTISIDPAGTSPSVDLGVNHAGAASGVIGDPADPLASVGIAFTLADSDGDASLLTVTVSSSNTSVVANSGLLLEGSGAVRSLRVVPLGVGHSDIQLRALDANGNSGSYTIRYAASAAAGIPANTIFATGAADASAAIAAGDHVFIADDENQVLRLYPRNRSGLHQAGFDFTASLGLTDIDGGVPREVDIEAAARLGNRIYWSGSHSNSKDGKLRPNRERVFATDVTGSGVGATLAYVGRYDFLRADLIAWDQSNGHGLGANALGFAAGTALNVIPERVDGFNIEGLVFAPDNQTAWLAFRAPLLPLTARSQALLVPVLHFATLVTGTAPASRPPGSAQFGAPVLLDLGGRAIRSIDRNVAGDYVITAGPPAGSTGIAPANFRLFGWNGNPASLPFPIAANPAAGGNDGSLEALVDVPDVLDSGSVLQVVSDHGDTVWYADGIIAKDLAEKRHAKFRIDSIPVDLPSPRDVILRTDFDAR